MEIWDSWKEHYRALGLGSEEICKDGILDENAYSQANPRILFVLKDMNKAPGLDLREHLKNGPVYQM